MEKKTKIGDDDDEISTPYLPQELIIDEILTRIPGRILARWRCVCKLWNSSTFNNKIFADIHLMRNQNKKKLFISLFNTSMFDEMRTSFFSLDDDDDDYKYRFLATISVPDPSELVGSCNGLLCVTKAYNEAYKGPRGMVIVNPIRREVLNLLYSYPDRGCKYLFHGFGFDPSTQDYKVVIVFMSKDCDCIICMVLTLGIKSWRKIVTNVADIPGSSSFPKPMVTRPSENIRTPATLCGGNILWRMVVENAAVIANKSHLLLSFDIHNEKIQFIRLPTECDLTPTPTATTALVVEHHLLEHKGYLCIARSEKARENKINQRHQDWNSQNSLVCCCRFTVQLYILKDLVKQVWVKGETLSVQVQQLGLAPAPFCCYFDTTTAAPITLPTRILSFSDQLLLYWFDGECLKFYNLQRNVSRW